VITKEELLARHKKWRERNRDKTRRYNENYRRKYPERWYKSQKRSNVRQRVMAKELKEKILKLFNNSCVRCNFSNIRALQIDHINGGGINDNKVRGKTFYKKVLKSIMEDLGEYQILCANCNWIKRYENGEMFDYLRKINKTRKYSKKVV